MFLLHYVALLFTGDRAKRADETTEQTGTNRVCCCFMWCVVLGGRPVGDANNLQIGFFRTKIRGEKRTVPSRG